MLQNTITGSGRASQNLSKETRRDFEFAKKGEQWREASKVN